MDAPYVKKCVKIVTQGPSQPLKCLFSLNFYFQIGSEGLLTTRLRKAGKSSGIDPSLCVSKALMKIEDPSSPEPQRSQRGRWKIHQ